MYVSSLHSIVLAGSIATWYRVPATDKDGNSRTHRTWLYISMYARLSIVGMARLVNGLYSKCRHESDLGISHLLLSVLFCGVISTAGYGNFPFLSLAGTAVLETRC